MTLIEVVDHDLDDDLPLLAGRTAEYRTDPHGWLVNRVGVVTATKGRLTVDLDADYITDSEDVREDECQYGIPSSSREALELAALYQEAEEIIEAHRDGRYTPPSRLPYYYNRKPRTFMSAMMDRFLSGVRRELTRDSFGFFDYSMPRQTRKEMFIETLRIIGRDPSSRVSSPPGR